MTAQLRRARRHGYLVVNGQAGGFPCMVKDLSEDSATLSLTGLMGIPQRFSLFIEPDAIKYACVVKNIRGNSVAVSFESKEENKRFRDHMKKPAA